MLERLQHFVIPAFHLFAAVHFWGACYYDWCYVHVPTAISPMGKTFGRTNKLKFLTFWDALLQASFFTFCLINDIFGDNGSKSEGSNKLRRIKDTIQGSLAFPISFFVGTTFWALYFVNRELVLPKAVDPYFPWWLNQCMHTNIMIFMMLEMLGTRANYPKRRIGFTILTVFMVIYLIWIHIIHSYTNMWVYPVLEVLSLPMRIVFFAGLLGLSIILYIIGEKSNEFLWKQTQEDGIKDD